MPFTPILPVAMAIAISMSMASLAPAASLQIRVPGTANPWLAGMPDGARASATDTAPAQSPIPVPGISLTRDTVLTFEATGLVGNTATPPAYPPEGNLGHIPEHGPGAENGIASAFLPMNSLVGIFLGPDRPDLTAAPGALNFSDDASRNFETLRPALKQVFYIGDGRNSSGQIQRFIAPQGATRLFLGTMDIWTSGDNVGEFAVGIAVANEAQTPGTWDAVADFGPTQASRGVWFYQEFDGTSFTDLIFQPSGNSFTANQPAFIGAGSALPTIFFDPFIPNGLIFHPGQAGAGPQPVRRDIALVWVSPTNAFVSIRGFIRGDSRFGIGGNGFAYSVFQDGESLLGRNVAADDKTVHPFHLRHRYVTAGQRISLRVHDKGNNEFDPGVFNLHISTETPTLRIRTSQVELCWNGEPGQTYQVQYRSELTTNAWIPFTTNCLVGAGREMCLYDFVPIDEPQRFYRLITNCPAGP